MMERSRRDVETPNIKMQRSGPQIPDKCNKLLPAADLER